MIDVGYRHPILPWVTVGELEAASGGIAFSPDVQDGIAGRWTYQTVEQCSLRARDFCERACQIVWLPSKLTGFFHVQPA